MCLLQLEAHDRMRSASNAERHATPWPPNGRPVSEADPGAREPMVKFVKLGIFAVSLCEGEMKLKYLSIKESIVDI